MSETAKPLIDTEQASNQAAGFAVDNIPWIVDNIPWIGGLLKMGSEAPLIGSFVKGIRNYIVDAIKPFIGNGVANVAKAVQENIPAVGGAVTAALPKGDAKPEKDKPKPAEPTVVALETPSPANEKTKPQSKGMS